MLSPKSFTSNITILPGYLTFARLEYKSENNLEISENWADEEDSRVHSGKYQYIFSIKV